jgi:hypothetical protein
MNSRKPDWSLVGNLGIGISNYEEPGQIEDGVLNTLLTTESLTGWAGWNYFGYVWHQDNRFHAEIWQFNNPIAYFTEEAFDDLIHQVLDNYGSE